MNDVYSTSTNSSTDLSSEIAKANTRLEAAVKAGARSETIEKLATVVKDLKRKVANEEVYKDIRLIEQWPDEVLIKHYDEAREYAIKIESEVSNVDLFNNEEKQPVIKRYEAALSLIEKLEIEGRKRDLIYFLSKDELLDTCKHIFGKGCKWVVPPTVASKGDQK